MSDELRVELEQIWAAIRALNQNDGALLQNVMRLSHRLSVHEAWTAAQEMDEPRANH